MKYAFGLFGSTEVDLGGFGDRFLRVCLGEVYLNMRSDLLLLDSLDSWWHVLFPAP